MSPHKELAEQLFPGVIPHLEQLPGVTDIKFFPKPPIALGTITSWERCNGVVLTDDLVAVLSVSAGFELSWSSNFNNTILEMGSLKLNALQDFSVTTDVIHDKVGPYTFCFMIENCEPYGETYLLYPSTTSEPEIWFRTLKAEWFMITKSYSAYFRLMASFLGIKGWQLGYYKKRGWAQDTQNWLYFYVPKRCAEMRLSKAEREFKEYKRIAQQKQVAEKNPKKKDIWASGIPSDSILY
jgi:hypothetical protein